MAIGTWDVPFQVNLVWYFDDSICCHKWGMCKANLLGKARYGFSVPDPFITPGPRPTKSQQLKEAALGNAGLHSMFVSVRPPEQLEASHIDIDIIVIIEQ